MLLVERESYPPDMQADEEKLRDRLEVFPEGQLIVLLDGSPAGYATNQILQFEPGGPGRCWLQCTNGGYVRSTHDPGGNALYFISTGVRAALRRRGIGSLLYDGRLALARRLGLRYAFANFRIQTLRATLGRIYGIGEREFLKLEDDQIRALGQDYIARVAAGEVEDPLRILFRRNFLLLAVIPWYMGDVESLHMGAVMYCSVETPAGAEGEG
jgi:GNAT superfamily N-acetyltransferase